MRDVILACVTGALMVLVLFGTYSIAHGAQYRREYERRPHSSFATAREYRTYRTFLRVKGMKGVPEGCELRERRGGDPENIRDLRMHCRLLRVWGSGQ